jgi:hypothetical protein
MARILPAPANQNTPKKGIPLESPSMAVGITAGFPPFEINGCWPLGATSGIWALAERTRAFSGQQSFVSATTRSRIALLEPMQYFGENMEASG